MAPIEFNESRSFTPTPSLYPSSPQQKSTPHWGIYSPIAEIARSLFFEERGSGFLNFSEDGPYSKIHCNAVGILNPRKQKEERVQAFGRFEETDDQNIIDRLKEVLVSRPSAIVELAALVNEKKIPLKVLVDKGFTNNDLMALAPALTYVDLRGLGDSSCSTPGFDSGFSLLGSLDSASSEISIVDLIRLCPDLRFLFIDKSGENLGVDILASCEFLDCSGCVNLINLPALPSCKHLDCHECRSLIKLPNLPLCENLRCTHSKIQVLPQLPCCKSIDCSYSEELEALPWVLPVCEYLKCVQCKLLATLSRLPLCEKLICDYCSSLERLPDLSDTAELSFMECFHLFGEFRQEDIDPIKPEGNPEVWKFSPEELTQDPKSLLLALSEILLESGCFPFIKHGDTDTIDAGGVSRDFISRLFAALFGEDQTALPYHQSDGLIWPSVNDDPNMQDLYEAVGMIFAHCIFGYEIIKTGAFFDPTLFKILAVKKNIANPDNEKIRKFLILKNIDLDVMKLTFDEDLGVPNLDLSTQEKVCGLLGDFSISFEKAFSTQETRKVLRENILEQLSDENPIDINRLKAASYILSGMKKCLTQDQQDLIESFSPEELQVNIQGELNKDLIKQRLRWNSLTNVQEAVNTLKVFLSKWLDDSDLERLKKFVFFVTGSFALGKQEIEIKIDLSKQHSDLPISHTCGPILDLPAYQTQEIFNAKFNRAVDETFAALEKGQEGFSFH